MKLPKEVKNIATELAEVIIELEAAKAKYKRRDELTQALKEHGTRFDLDDGCLVIVDNFAEKNTQYKVAAVSRFEAKFEQAAGQGPFKVRKAG